MKQSQSCKNLKINVDQLKSSWVREGSLATTTNKSSKNKTHAHFRNISEGVKHPKSCKHNFQKKESIQLCFTKQSDGGPQDESEKSDKKKQKILADDYPYPDRRKELDSLCFHRLFGQVKKYFMDEQVLWNFHHLRYDRLLGLLHALRYTRYGNEEEFMQKGDTEELKKAYFFWLVLCDKQSFSLVDFFIVVSIIENLEYEVNTIEQSVADFQKQLCQLPLKEPPICVTEPKYVFFIKRMALTRTQKNHLNISPLQREKISAQFQLFKLNKLKAGDQNACEQAEQEQEGVLISKKSYELAENKRKKIVEELRSLNPSVENIDLVDFLGYRSRKEEMQSVLESRNICENVGYRGAKDMKTEVEKLAKPKIQPTDKTADEISFEKNRSEFTFKPKVNEYKTTKNKEIKNAEKVVLRMKEARELKQQKENIIQKGWAHKPTPTNKENQEKKKKSLSYVEVVKEKAVSQDEPLELKEESKQEKQKLNRYETARIPILYIDVNIEEGKKQRIIIYDSDRASTLATEFGDKHNLPPQTVQRLQIMLQQQINSVLSRIEEETEEEESFLY